MHKKFFALFILSGLFSCKKSDSSNGSNTDISGTWRLASVTSKQFGVSFATDTASYPCLSENELIINSDGTAKLQYTGADTCYISSNTSLYLGVPGEATSASWVKNNNSFIFNLNYSADSTVKATATIGSSNNKTTLIVKDTIQNYNLTTIQVFVK
jgi:hypothetical protein